jgi:hypothetical protein
MIENGEFLQKIAAGLSGSALGVWLAKVTGVDRVVSFVGGAVCAQIFTEHAVNYFRLMNGELATAFTIGLLSMVFIRKLFEGLASIDTKELAGAFVAKVRLWLGVK